jgi:hypothetical protein
VFGNFRFARHRTGICNQSVIRIVACYDQSWMARNNGLM